MKYILKQTRLAKDFSCLMNGCPSTCCTDWSVVWRNEEVQRLKNTYCGISAEKINSSFRDIKGYSELCMDENNFCPFLNDGLCEIHKNYGEEYLSYTCREYPRLARLTENEILKSCKSTCYAVMEKLVSDNSCMDILTSCAEKSITAVISPTEAVIRQRQADIAQQYLWSDMEVTEALIKSAENLGVATCGSKMTLDEVFEDIFGWNLSLPKSKAGNHINLCENAECNIIKSMFLEWKITSLSETGILADCFCGFIFAAAVIRRVMREAAECAASVQEYICTLSDISGILLSDKSAFESIVNYLADNRLNNLGFLSCILI